jgi:signal transduction histidine kinase
MNNKIIVNILGELKNLDQVVNDLTDIISLREVEHRTSEQISFHEELKQVTVILSDQINACDATITEDFHEAPEVYSIRSYMHSIFINLISNAVKYCSTGRKPEIKVRTQIVESFICLSVQDNGLGIDLEKYGSKLFTLYKRFHKHVDGRGIGLYMVKTQVESLGGKIEVISREGEGTTFNVFLPKN